jgi:protein-S-isoprenylcysteine O-methyltransferase Ste14
MSNEQTFRAILVIGLLIVMPIGIYHRIRSHTPREPLDRRKEGLFILATLRPIGLILWVGLIAYIVNPASMAWSSVPLPAWPRWIGVGIFAAGGALLVWTLRSLGKNLTDTVVTRREHTLVSTGPYRWVRHPFYDSAALFLLGASLVAANWFLFAAGVMALALLVVRTRREEEQLIARFGDAYRAYMNRTGRFLPVRPGGRTPAR